MEVCCNLEVDVNGEEIFVVDKKLIASYSGRLSKLFGRSKAKLRNYKLIFHDFPGGAEGFEMMLKFCYNNGKIKLISSNICLLHSAAQFMEMNSSISGGRNLLEQTEEYLEDISSWSWSELLSALKQCQDLHNFNNTGGPSFVVLEKCLDSLVGRLNLAFEASSCCPSTSSPDSSALRFSCDTKSTESLKAIFSNGLWWFEELLVFSPEFVELIVQLMFKRSFDEVVIGKFLIFYQKSKSLNSTRDEKRKIVGFVVDMLYNIDYSAAVSCNSLFGIFRVALNLNLNKCIRSKLETMIGSRLDQGSLDNLLLPSPCGTNYLYDVNLVLRFVKAFLHPKTIKRSQMQLERVARLIDLYMAEVAPDPCLKPSKFLALASSLPDSARNSYDSMYHAMEIYIEVHTEMSVEEKVKMCCALNYEKLSAEVCLSMSRNIRFPSKSSIETLIHQQTKLTSLLQISNNNPKSVTNSPRKLNEGGSKTKRNEDNDQVVLYAGKLEIPDDDETKLKAHLDLQGIQWRVMELERVCKKMQAQMAKAMKARSTSHHNSQLTKSLPWLCS